MALEHASEALRDHRLIVDTAVLKEGVALQFASEELRNSVSALSDRATNSLLPRQARQSSVDSEACVASPEAWAASFPQESEHREKYPPPLRQWTDSR